MTVSSDVAVKCKDKPTSPDAETLFSYFLCYKTTFVKNTDCSEIITHRSDILGFQSPNSLKQRLTFALGDRETPTASV